MADKVKKISNNILIMIIVMVVVLIALVSLLSRSYLIVKVSPVNAIVKVDDKKIGLTKGGVGRIFIKPGERMIRAEADGYSGLAKSINLKRGFVNKVEFNLTELAQPTKVSEGKFLYKADEENIYFLGEEGTTVFHSTIKVKSDLSLDISTIAISNPVLSGIKEMIWSPDQKLVLLRKQNGLYLFDFQKYDFVNQSETFWGSTDEIGFVAWSPDNSKIAYTKNTNNGEKMLVFSDITNTQKENVLNLAEAGIENPVLRWSSDGEKILMVPRDLSLEDNKIYLFDVTKRTLMNLTDTGNQTDAGFSPDASSVLYTSISRDTESSINTLLSTMNADGKNQKSFDIKTNLSRISFINNDNIFFIGYDKSSKKSGLFKLSLANKQSFSLQPKNWEGSFDAVSSVLDGRVVVFQSGETIYALGLN